MKADSIKEFVKYSSAVIIPTIFSILVYSQTGMQLPLILIRILFGLVAVLGSVCIIYGLRKYLCHGRWKREIRKALKKPLIGIIKEDGCPLEKTKFKPEDWKVFLKEHKTKYISTLKISEINDKYVAIINPYGECYPEINILEKTSFNRIEEYVKNGGIFVSTAGCAFWYAWNKESIGSPPTAKEVYKYEGPIHKDAIPERGVLTVKSGVTLMPTYQMPPLYSLTETLTFERLGMLTSTGLVKLAKISQDSKDKKYFGNLENLTENKTIFEFRAIRKPVQSCVPLLTAEILTGFTTHEAYPFALIPHGEGKFVFTGMHMNIEPNEKILRWKTDKKKKKIEWQIIKGEELNQEFISKVLEGQTKIVCTALKNIIENEKEIAKYLSIKKQLKKSSKAVD